MLANHYDIESRAMLIHHCKTSGVVDVTVHSVHSQNDDQQVIGEGRVLGFEEKVELSNIFNEDTSQVFALQSSQLLAKTPYALAWWTPKAEREPLFKNTEGVIERFTVTFPTMVGIYMRGALHFAVTKTGKNARPENDTPLFRIPLPNLYGSGFCRGNANTPTGAKEAHIPAWQSFVFDTTNTHLGSAMPFKGVSNITDTIAAYAKAEAQGRFPTSRLIPMEITLGEWMEQLDKGKKA